MFDKTVVFSSGELRSYLFLISAADGRKLDSNIEITLGTLCLDWKNYFGDPGSLKVGPFKTLAKQPHQLVDLEIECVTPMVLVLETPSLCRFRIHNLSEKTMLLSVDLIESAQTDCLITEIEPAMLGRLNPHSSVEM